MLIPKKHALSVAEGFQKHISIKSSTFYILNSPFKPSNIIRTALQNGGGILRKSPLHGVHYSYCVLRIAYRVLVENMERPAP